MGARNVTLDDLHGPARRQAEDALIEEALRAAKAMAEPKPKAKRTQKFNAKPIVVDGIRFDSQAEAKHWSDLQKLERAGEISELQRQIKFVFLIDGKPILIRSEGYPNGRKAKLTVDFQYRDRTGQLVAEDRKGGKATATESYKLRRGLFELLFPDIKFVEVSK